MSAPRLSYRRFSCNDAAETWSADGPFGTTVYVERHGTQWSWKVWLGSSYICTTLASSWTEAKVAAEAALADAFRRAVNRLSPEAL